MTETSKLLDTGTESKFTSLRVEKSVLENFREAALRRNKSTHDIARMLLDIIVAEPVLIDNILDDGE